jgi:hypothetical protein
VVGIATSIRAGRYGARIPVMTLNFSLLQTVQIGSRAHKAPYSIGTGVPSRGVERPENEVGHSPLSSAEFKNGWSYTYIPP